MNRLVFVFCLCAATPAYAQKIADKSPHHINYFTHDGIRLQYLDWGGPTKDPVLLLPGLNLNAHVFDDFAPVLNDLFKVIALTPRAHGASGTPDSTMSVNDQVEDIAALMDSLHTGPMHIVAHGLSGAVATAFAVRYPKRVRKLVYLDATAPAGTLPQDLDETGKPFPLPKESHAWETMRAIEESVSPEVQQQRRRVRASFVADAAAHPPAYAKLKGNVLALRANKTMKSNYFWVAKSDANAIRSAQAQLDTLNALDLKGVGRFDAQIDKGMGKSEVLDGQNLMFITDARKVGFVVRAFLRVLPSRAIIGQ